MQKFQEFTPSERRFLRSLSSPAKIQKFLDNIPYHLASTAFSPRLVMREKTAHCLEGAIFAAAALRFHGYAPLLLDFEAVHDTDHVIAPFEQKGAWGAVAISNFSGLRYRAPVYKNVRELALSYFNDYLNLRGERTMRTYSTKPVNLKIFDSQDWTTREDNIWFIAEYLCEIPHTPLLTTSMIKNLTPLDKRSIKAAKVGMRFKK